MCGKIVSLQLFQYILFAFLKKFPEFLRKYLQNSKLLLRIKP